MQRLQKPLVFALCLGPFLWLLGRFLTDNLSANPIEDITLTTGIWTLRFLVFTLAVTPIRRLTGWNKIIQYRRMLGLFAFFYASLHVLLYAVIDQGLSPAAIIEDVTERKFITAGFCAFVLLVPLALTSTSAMLKRLGAARWKRLHRLAYLAGVLAAVHFVWRVKRDFSQPLAYAFVLAVLLAVRVLDARRGARISAGSRRNP